MLFCLSIVNIRAIIAAVPLAIPVRACVRANATIDKSSSACVCISYDGGVRHTIFPPLHPIPNYVGIVRVLINSFFYAFNLYFEANTQARNPD